jgi:EAL domain-containing protein (putative c-di-GMP-specific phosphodiesterase class I)
MTSAMFVKFIAIQHANSGLKMTNMNWGSPERHRELVHNGGLVNHYQPIVDLQSGIPLGVEVLGRLVDDGKIIPPYFFLSNLDNDHSEALLFNSMKMGLVTLTALDSIRPCLRMSFNVSPSVMARTGFVERLMGALKPDEAKRITLEILEEDFPQGFDPAPCARALQAYGIRLSLDDVGTGSSSLMRIKQISGCGLKLDQEFVKTLHEEPDSLPIVANMLNMAHDMGCKMTVEGVETLEIMGALAVLGVQDAQGYAIARPMPREKILGWLDEWGTQPVSSHPTSLLGSYASLIRLRAMRRMADSHGFNNIGTPKSGCDIGRYLRSSGRDSGKLWFAYELFRSANTDWNFHNDKWLDAADRLKDAFLEELSSNSVEDKNIVLPNRHQNVGSHSIQGNLCNMHGALASAAYMKMAKSIDHHKTKLDTFYV